MSDTTTRYRKKPVEIGAIQFTDNGSAWDILEWAGTPPIRPDIEPADGKCLALLVDTREGTMTAEPGDWIIRGVDGDFSRVKPDVFAATYEPVGDGGAENASDQRVLRVTTADLKVIRRVLAEAGYELPLAGDGGE